MSINELKKENMVQIEEHAKLELVKYKARIRGEGGPGGLPDSWTRRKLVEKVVYLDHFGP